VLPVRLLLDLEWLEWFPSETKERLFAVESGDSKGDAELGCAKGADGTSTADDGFVSTDAPEVTELALLLPPATPNAIFMACFSGSHQTGQQGRTRKRQSMPPSYSY